MKRVYGKYLLALLLFGSNGIVASYIPLNSVEIVLFRSFIGGLFLLAVFLLSKGRFPGRAQKRDLGFLLISGVSMGLSWMCLYEAFDRVGVSLATLVYSVGPVLVMILAPVVFKERLTLGKVLGFLTVLLGMFLVNQGELERSGLSSGLLFAMLSAVTFAGMIIFNKKAAGIVGLTNTLCQVSVGFFTTALFTLFKQGFSFHIPWPSLPVILVLGLVNTGMGCYLYFSSLPRLPAQSVAIWGYLEPVSALFFAALFLRERLLVPQLIGAALILSGAAFAELYHPRRQRAPIPDPLPLSPGTPPLPEAPCPPADNTQTG